MSQSRPAVVADAKADTSPLPCEGGTRLPTVGGSSLSGWNLNDNAFTRAFFTSSTIHSALQISAVAIFFWGILQAFIGPRDASSNFGAVTFFGLWWTPVMLLSLLLFGRIWCYVCPIGSISQFLQRFSLNRHFPTFRKQQLRVFGAGFSVLSIAALSFTLARLPLYKYGVAFTPWKMGVYFLVFLSVAVALTLVFRQRVFCRYVCPATGVMSVTTRLSPFEISQDRDSEVPDCMTAEFRSNYLSTERRCVSCMHCSVGQPDVAIRLRARWPGAAAVRQHLMIADEAIIALIIWAVFPIDHVLGGEIFSRLAVVRSLPGLLPGIVPYYASIGLTIVAFTLVNLVAARWAQLDARTAFVRFAFAYVPLGVGFQLGVHLIPGLMENGGGLLNAFGAGLGLPLHLQDAWASADTHAAWMRFGNGGFLWLTALWGMAIAWFIARSMTRNAQAAIRALAPHAALMTVSTYAVVTLLS